MIISTHLAEATSQIGTAFEQMRIAAGIITGIGFLGAGTIMKSGQEKVGLTTAATVWFSAALGIAVGAGYLITPFIATAFVLAVVIGLFSLEQILPQRGYFSLSLQLPSEGANLEELLKDIRSSGPFEASVSAVKDMDAGAHVQMVFQIHSPSTTDFSILLNFLRTRYAHAQKISLERLQT